jgi:hypothetical protein
LPVPKVTEPSLPAGGHSSDGTGQVDATVCDQRLDAERALAVAEQILVYPDSLPVAALSANTVVVVSPYTTPLATIGVAASDPKPGPDVTSDEGSLKVHACCRPATLADEMVAPAASRVFSGSPFGYSREPAGMLMLLQPARTTPTARIRLGHAIFLAPAPWVS